ncbi:phospho-N-acetylmuramoyl-pentapeptide-transferase [Candidatus Peribacteria bacterium]|nr:phospho-N-acetylmuramoyl-pentapeptide-transferase [Candidatus Peribacteria bacterium]
MKSLHIAHLLQLFAYTGFTFFVAAILYPDFIALIQRLKFTKKIREDSITGDKATIFQQFHAHKAGTPNMGGVLVVASVTFTVLLSRLFSLLGIIDSSLLNRGETYLALFTLLCVGGLGMLDDYLNIIERGKVKGLSSRVKWWTLLLFSLVGAWWFTCQLGWSQLTLPWLGLVDIGYWYFPLFMLVMVSTTHAVNITDGLDGLAGGLLAIAFTVYAVIAYLQGLPILATFCMLVVGALVAFLWFNVPPASIFMGDTGALSLGATLGVVAMLTDTVVLLPVIGLIFAMEALSSLSQIASKKLVQRGMLQKKLWPVAPLHHYFEHRGWSETQIVMRFWILGAICGGVGLIIALFMHG